MPREALEIIERVHAHADLANDPRTRLDTIRWQSGSIKWNACVDHPPVIENVCHFGGDHVIGSFDVTDRSSINIRRINGKPVSRNIERGVCRVERKTEACALATLEVFIVPVRNYPGRQSDLHSTGQTCGRTHAFAPTQRLSTEFHVPSGESAAMTGSANNATRSRTVENSAGTLDSIRCFFSHASQRRCARGA